MPVDGKKPLSVRTWRCPCGAVHDRDMNAATNILAAGQTERLNACEGQVGPAPGLAPAIVVRRKSLLATCAEIGGSARSLSH
ncbi:zinc ribbon domain-containing protein [Nocardia vinacea]|uniref:zinc ribbon domain-containing protein n=1 Tax=Nocardia vinacea TaxID=96468 RepID=UPI0033EC6044